MLFHKNKLVCNNEYLLKHQKHRQQKQFALPKEFAHLQDHLDNLFHHIVRGDVYRFHNYIENNFFLEYLSFFAKYHNLLLCEVSFVHILAIAAAVENFTAETGIEVQLEYKGREGIRDTLQAVLDGTLVIQQPVDVFDGDLDYVNTAFAPWLLNLEALAKNAGYEDSAMPSMVAACREAAGGQLMSIPYQANVVGFFYNADIFEKVGVSAPKTWAELLTVCEQIKAAGYTPITADDTTLIGHHLGRLVGEAGVRDIVTNAKWDDPAVVQFANDYAELAAKGYFSPNIATNVYPNGQNGELASGQAAMYLTGSWMPNAAKGFAGEAFRWGCFPYPAVNNGTVGTEAVSYGAQVLAIHVKSQVSEEAFRLIRYLTSGKADKTLSTMSFGIPADTANEWPAMIAVAKPVLDSATIRWTAGAGIDANADMVPYIARNVQLLCAGTITAEQFVENMLVASGR